MAGPDAKDVIMTAGERLIQQGVQQGERALLLRQLRKRFGDQVDGEMEKRVAAASSEQLASLASQLLFAATLRELFVELLFGGFVKVLVIDQVEREAMEAFVERVAGPDTKDAITADVERLIQRVQREVQQGERALLLRQLRKRFGDQVDGELERRVAAASSEQIAVWAERVLSAATLGELLAE